MDGWMARAHVFAELVPCVIPFFTRPTRSIRGETEPEMLFSSKVLSFVILVGGLAFQGDASPKQCLKHNILIHNIKPKYYMDNGETIKVWVKIVHDPWQDNRLIGGVSDPSAISFNLSCVQQATDFKGIVTRNMTAVIFEHPSNLAYSDPNRANNTGEFEFYIKEFSENDECHPVKVTTKVIVGCPVRRRLQIYGHKFEGCQEFKDYNYTISRQQLNQNSSKVISYDFENLGCPITSIITSHFKPIIHVYDDEKFVAEVIGGFLMWENHGRKSYHYSMTMQQAGCVTAPQDWSEMIESLKAPNIDQEQKQQVYHSCFNVNSSSNTNEESNLNMPYEIMNSTGGSAIKWDDGGMYVFKLRIIDPQTSFCDLTAEFAVYVGFTKPAPEQVPTFVVLGASCLGILLGTLAAYFIDLYCL